MRKPLTDKAMFHAAVRALRNHLEVRPMTKTEVAAATSAAEQRMANHLENAKDDDSLVRMSQTLFAGWAKQERDSLAAIADSPWHAYQQTAANLAERVNLYAKKAGVVC
jgi:hypothetical protein